jgi:SSS family solute:Na+ symporter
MEGDLLEVALSTPDYVVMALYLAGLVGLGLYYRKFANKNLENYFLAGRQFKGWITGTRWPLSPVRGSAGSTLAASVWR